MATEIQDVRRIQRQIGDPAKYNEAMLEMLEYFKCLEKNGLLPWGRQDSMNSYQINPYVGVGSLKFGMSPEGARAVVGPADEVANDREEGTLTEFRLDSALQLTYELGSRHLVGVSLYHPLEGIAVDGLELDWSDSEHWLAELKRRDPAHGRTYGIDVFFKFGVSASGLQHPDNGGKSVSAFAQGQWDPDSPDLTPRRG